MSFKLNAYLNKFLPTNGTRVDAVISVTPEGSGSESNVVMGRRAVALIGDKSGSMDGEKMATAKRAARIAVDQLPEDVMFTVIFFDSTPDVVVPMVQATRSNKQAAHAAIQRVEARGGTAIGRSLLKARDAFAQYPDAVCQAVLLTDGKNEGESASELDSALSACQGKFQVQALGFGTDWDQRELMGIASRLLGEAHAVTKIASLENFFKDAVLSALSKSISDVRLRLWMPKSVSLTLFKQGFPVEIDMTNRASPVDQRTVEFPLGSFGKDAQDYFLSFNVTAQSDGEQSLVCRPSIVWRDPATGGQVEVKGENVTVEWTPDANYSMRISREVAHYSGQAEKAQAIQEGLDAAAKGDVAEATMKLGRALKLAQESGDEATTRRIRQVVDVVDENAGTVQLRRNVQKAELMDLEVGSTRAVRAKTGA